MQTTIFLLSLIALFLHTSHAFQIVQPATITRTTRPIHTRLYNDANGNGSSSGKIEQIEFRIFPDGRIEETVRGIKGGECHKVTEDLNNVLGKVVASQPTEEMYEQEIVLDNTVSVTENNDNSGGWDGASTW